LGVTLLDIDWLGPPIEIADAWLRSTA